MAKRVHTYEGESIRVTWDAQRRGTPCALGRCGGSARKPWCDGTHKHNELRSG